MIDYNQERLQQILCDLAGTSTQVYSGQLGFVIVLDVSALPLGGDTWEQKLDPKADLHWLELSAESAPRIPRTDFLELTINDRVCYGPAEYGRFWCPEPIQRVKIRNVSPPAPFSVSITDLQIVLSTSPAKLGGNRCVPYAVECDASAGFDSQPSLGPLHYDNVDGGLWVHLAGVHPDLAVLPVEDDTKREQSRQFYGGVNTTGSLTDIEIVAAGVAAIPCIWNVSVYLNGATSLRVDFKSGSGGAIIHSVTVRAGAPQHFAFRKPLMPDSGQGVYVDTTHLGTGGTYTIDVNGIYHDP